LYNSNEGRRVMEKLCKNCKYDYLNGENVSYTTNEIVFSLGQKLDSIYHINDGYVKMVRYLENGDERIIGILGPGDYLALLGVLQNKENYLATAIAITKIEVKKISRNEVINAYQKCDSFKERCLNCAVTRSNLFKDYLIQSANIDVKERVINTLKILFEKFGYIDDSQQILDLPFSKTVLANIIGIRRETLSRVLSKLQKEDIIWYKNNKYILKYVI